MTPSMEAPHLLLPNKNVHTEGRTADRANDEGSTAQQEHKGDTIMGADGFSSPEANRLVGWGRRLLVGATAVGVFYTNACGGEEQEPEVQNRPVPVATTEAPPTPLEVLPTTPEAPPPTVKPKVEALPPVLKPTEYYPLPTRGTPQQLATAFCEGISAAFNSTGPDGNPRVDVLKTLFLGGSPEAEEGLQAELRALQAYTVLKQNSGPGTTYVRECTVERVRELTGFTGPKSIEIDVRKNVFYTDAEGNIVGTAADGVPVVQWVLTPDVTVNLPNGNQLTGYAIARYSEEVAG